ncbi:MAG TPA: asparagine synthase (glutamine-hydrolyzing) [Candidatus Sulfotelmatobacter sp.]|nr:asparagine synthase (glutamine-hydrolyzing) [Candidatus Sulfotelmatobacter sp.]
MCGICGKLEFDLQARVSPALVKAMADTISHRGPDDEGYYVSGPIGLGFRRLSIIDLNTGHQPISNEDGTVWIVFNGEIYNYQELREHLLSRGHVFKTRTDTEVIVHLYEEFGEGCVEKLRGMFAFAIWDDRTKSLFIARDRLGIKPLYYASSPKSLVFASEMKAILADPEVRREVEPATIDRFLSFNYTPGEETFFKNIRKLEPGHYMVARQGELKIRQYWDLRFSTAPEHPNQKQAEEQLVHLLEESVRLHMISDVPVGFLLSGGLDSTAMLSLAAGKTDQPISSYTIGFSEPGIEDERPYARLAANRYGVKHYEMTITSKDFVDFLPQYVWHMEEGVCEPPAVALYYISKLAKERVKVLISGEGGDEAFAGYPNYRNLLWLERLKSAAGPLKGVFSGALGALNSVAHSEKIAKYLPLFDMPLSSYYYSRTASPFSFFNQKANPVYSTAFASAVDKRKSLAAVQKYLQGDLSNLNKMLYVDTKTWLPDDLLVKADKITMANSIELRVPFLDHKVMEFAASLPANFKVHGFTTKYLAKKALSQRVPQEIINRKKTGFPVPYESWLRTDLNSWLRDLLFSQRAMERGYFDRRGVERLFSKNSETGAYSKEIFCLAVLELWHRIFSDGGNLPVSHEGGRLGDNERYSCPVAE